MKKKTMIDYAWTFLGTKYVWGGNTPEEGLDCSAYVLEVLRSKYGNLPDMTSQDLLYYSLDKLNGEQLKRHEIAEEDLIFYGKSMSNITHVGLALNNTQLIESSGEGRISTTKGFVRVRPIDYRNDFICGVQLI